MANLIFIHNNMSWLTDELQTFYLTTWPSIQCGLTDFMWQTKWLPLAFYFPMTARVCVCSPSHPTHSHMRTHRREPCCLQFLICIYLVSLSSLPFIVSDLFHDKRSHDRFTRYLIIGYRSRWQYLITRRGRRVTPVSKNAPLPVWAFILPFAILSLGRKDF